MSLYELDSEAFLETVGGNRAASHAVDELIDSRLGEIAQIGGRIPP